MKEVVISNNIKNLRRVLNKLDKQGVKWDDGKSLKDTKTKSHIRKAYNHYWCKISIIIKNKVARLYLKRLDREC
ncbi:hypothetical protein ACSW9O_15605 (plasmid) [Clostridium perfringens]|nr:hypothetical protein [Clostridium perfringens]